MVENKLNSAGRDSEHSESVCDAVSRGLWNDVDSRGPDKAKKHDLPARDLSTGSNGLTAIVSGLLAEYKNIFTKDKGNRDKSSSEINTDNQKQTGSSPEAKTSAQNQTVNNPDAVKPGQENISTAKSEQNAKSKDEAENGSAQETGKDKDDSLSLTPEGNVDLVDTSEKSYRFAGSVNGKDQYLVTTPDDSEGLILNGNLRIKNGNVTVSDNDTGVKQEYVRSSANAESEKAQNTDKFYEYAHQATVAATQVFAGPVAAAAVEVAFNNSGKIQEWYNQASEKLQKAAETAPNNNAEIAAEAKSAPAGEPGSGETRADLGPLHFAEDKPESADDEPLANHKGAKTVNSAGSDDPDPLVENSNKVALSYDKLADGTPGTVHHRNSISGVYDSEPTAAEKALPMPGESGLTSRAVSLDGKVNDALSAKAEAFATHAGESMGDFAAARQFAMSGDTTYGALQHPGTTAEDAGGTGRTSRELSRTANATFIETVSATRPADLPPANANNDKHLQSVDSPAFKPQPGYAAPPDVCAPIKLEAHNPGSQNPFFSFAGFERISTAAALAKGQDIEKAGPEALCKFVAQAKDFSSLTISTLRNLDIFTGQGKAESQILQKPEGPAQPSRLAENISSARTEPARTPDQLTEKTAPVTDLVNRSQATNSLLPPSLSQILNAPLNSTLNPALTSAFNPVARAQLDINAAPRIDGQATGARVAPDGVQGRLDITGRTVRSGDMTGRADVSAAVALASGKGRIGTEGRYMIAELTLAMVLAAGGIRRLLPTDRAGRGDSGNGSTGSVRKQIDRDLRVKLQDHLRPDSFRFNASTFKLAQQHLLRDSNAIRNTLTSFHLENGRRLFLSPEGKSTFARVSEPYRREIPALVHQSQPIQISLGFMPAQLVPVFAEAGSGRHLALPAEPSILDQFLRVQQAALEGALAPLVDAAHDFIEMDDPFQSFKDVFVARGSYRSRQALENNAGEQRTGDGRQGEPDDEDSSRENNPVLLRPTRLINEGETLISIAEEHFADPYIGWLIADLNRGNCQEHWLDGKRIVEFQTRQQICLPVWQDIVEFYGAMPAAARPENLVTIVTRTQLDRQVVNNALGRIFGSKNTRKDTEQNGLSNSAQDAAQPGP